MLVNGWARLARADDYPAGLPGHVHERFLDAIEAQWGTGAHAAALGPSVVARPGVVEWWGRVERYGATPGEARARMETILALDVRNVLPLIEASALVVHNAGNALVNRLVEEADLDHVAQLRAILVAIRPEFHPH